MKYIAALCWRAFVLAALFSTTITCLHAQSPDTSAKLVQAAVLLNESQPQAAQTVLATVDTNDPAYPTAKGYTALSAYALGDKLGFWRVLDSAAVDETALPPDAQETFDFDRIDVLFYFRKFEQLLPRIAEFQAGHADSARLGAVTEYQMAGLYERGMKKMSDAGLVGKDAEFAGHWLDGQSNLVQFLNLAAALNETNYQTLTNRDLPQEIVKAMTALGNDQAVRLVRPADREKTDFLSLELHQKLQPRAADDNLRRMTNFLNDFPNTKYQKRVRYYMANTALEEGWRRHFTNRAAAAPYTELARSLFRDVAEDKEAGISTADVQQAQVGILRAYFAQRDWADVSRWAAQMITNSPPGEREWLVARLYDAAGLVCQNRLAEADNELDEILATGFKGNPSYDGLLASAAEWRLRAAQKAGDGAAVQRMVKLVQDSACVGSVKRTFMNNFKDLLPQAEPNSK